MQAMLALAMGTALLGIDVGWQPIEEGGLEYIVQIDPETLARMKPGDEFATGIRPVLRDVRRYRIVIGKGPLPRIALPENPASPSGSREPRPAPVPLAAADPSQRSIVVPAERGATLPSSIGVAPMAPVQPPGRVAIVPRLSPTPLAIPELKPATTTVPPADRTAGRTMPSFDALPDAPAKSLPRAPQAPVAAATPDRDWKPSAALAAPTPAIAPKSSPPPATLKLNDALAAPPIAIPKAEPKTAPKPAPKAEPKPPAFDPGDRYRDAERYPPTDRAPADDRYRDFAPPASSQPKASPVIPPPAKAPEDRSTDISAKSDNRLAEKSKPPTSEFVGPVLPPQWNDTPQTKPKLLAVPPSFDIDSGTDDRVARPVNEVKSPPVAKRAPRISPPTMEVKEPVPMGGSRLLAENFDQKPASLVNDPSVRPVSTEPMASTAPSLPASAAKPAAPVPAATPETVSRPWLPLTLTLFTLFASIGGNIFLGWVAHDARSRYGSLLRENRGLTA
ncbi:MAG: hypothetical protein K8T91_22825 [Planctomycetes bacterium]|nr:hypothetical protein [Planctomycetota bacterium]